MSATLKWEPVVRPWGILPYELRRVLQDSRPALNSGRVVMGDADKPYLEGLRDGKVAGAEQLLEAIEKNGSVVLWLEY